MTDTPLVSVIMPVYNGEHFLREAVESILDQTLKDFEFIIINDGSADGTKAILESYQDKRLKILHFQKNQGISTCVNTGLDMAIGQYIARMDADDISQPTRFEKQIRFFEDHKEIGICGTWVELMGDTTGVIWKYPSISDAIYARMLFNSAIANPSVMMRAVILKQHNLKYMTDRLYGEEDYDLWSRALFVTHFANIPEVLLQYRIHSSSISRVNQQKLEEGVRTVVYPRLLSRLGIEYSESDLYLHGQIGQNHFGTDLVFLKKARQWLEQLAIVNRHVNLIAPYALETELGDRWTQICSFSQEQPWRVFLQILSSPLPYRNYTGIIKMVRAFVFLARKSLRRFRLSN